MITKVCGLCQAENIQAVAKTGIQWTGFIFYTPSPRCLLRDPAEAERVRQLITADAFRPKRVGVFVNASQEEIMEVAQQYRLDYLQLHGHESPDFCYALQKRGYALIKAFSIATAEDLAHTADYAGRVDYFLFDTKCAGYGGSGQRFDWSLLQDYQDSLPVERRYSPRDGRRSATLSPSPLGRHRPQQRLRVGSRGEASRNPAQLSK